jgi:hypothetical protein
LRVILPDQESLQACPEELDEQTTILRDGYRRLDDWINGNDEDVSMPVEEPLRCITFDAAAQAAIPPDIRAKMDADRAAAEAARRVG